MIVKKLPKIRYQKDLIFGNLSITEALISGKITEINDSCVAVISKKGRLYELNIVAALFWEKIIGDTDVNEIAKFISLLFSSDEKQIYTDLVELAEELSKHGIIEII